MKSYSVQLRVSKIHQIYPIVLFWHWNSSASWFGYDCWPFRRCALLCPAMQWSVEWLLARRMQSARSRVEVPSWERLIEGNGKSNRICRFHSLPRFCAFCSYTNCCFEYLWWIKNVNCFAQLLAIRQISLWCEKWVFHGYRVLR